MASGADGRVAEALSLLQQGELQLGEVLLRQAVAEQPGHPGALGLLGQLYHARGLSLKKAGRLEEALAAYDDALAAAPHYFEAHHNRGVVLRLLGRHDEAQESARRAVSLQPTSADAHNGLGIALLAAGRSAAALEAFEQALQLRPHDADAINNRGMALHELGRLDDAAAAFEQSLAVDSRSPRTLMNLGVVRHAQRRYPQALAALDRAQSAAPADLDVRLNRASTLAELGRWDEALSALRSVCDARPRDTGALLNLANTLRDMQRQDEALPVYEQALAVDFEDADLHWNYSLCLLAAGDSGRGWPEYEWRWRAGHLGTVERAVDAPKWLGAQSLQGRTILLHAEQGLGDTLQLVRYVPMVAALGARVVLEAQRPLLPLLEKLPGVTQLCGPGEAQGRFDFHCPLFSLPLAFGTSFDRVPAPLAYLQPEPARVERWRPVVRNGAQPQIGLAWSGNPDYPGNERRSVPLAALLDAMPQGVRCWCLQKDVPPPDQPLVDAGRVHLFEDNAFADTAAQISLLDAVVSIDTSLAHLACALGMRTFILLGHAPDARWLREREDSPWYPTARLLRQASPGDWTEPLRKLSAGLDDLAASP